MERGKGLSLNAWADHTTKANLRCFSPLDRQHTHHHMGTSTGCSSEFYWAKTHIGLCETSQKYKTLRCAIFQLQRQPHYLGPFSLLQVLQTNQEQSTAHAVLPLVKALPSVDTAQLNTTNYCGFCKIQAKIQQKFWGLKATFYRDRENRLMKAGRKSLNILTIIQT